MTSTHPCLKRLWGLRICRDHGLCYSAKPGGTWTLSLFNGGVVVDFLLATSAYASYFASTVGLVVFRVFVVGLLLLILSVSIFVFLYSLLFGYSCVFSMPSSCCSYFGNVHVGNHFCQLFSILIYLYSLKGSLGPFCYLICGWIGSDFDYGIELVKERELNYDMFFAKQTHQMFLHILSNSFPDQPKSSSSASFMASQPIPAPNVPPQK